MRHVRPAVSALNPAPAWPEKAEESAACPEMATGPRGRPNPQTSRTTTLASVSQLLTHEFFPPCWRHPLRAGAGYEILLNNGPAMRYYEHAQRRQGAGIIIAQPLGHNSSQPLLESTAW